MAPDPPVRRRGKTQQSTSDGSVKGGRWLARERGSGGGGSVRGGSVGIVAAVAASRRW